MDGNSMGRRDEGLTRRGTFMQKCGHAHRNVDMHTGMSTCTKRMQTCTRNLQPCSVVLSC
eukprot:334998-Chlamydomonas_euryale.AAC.4